MFYFKFKIPKMPDGSPVLYSPNWCGTRDRCAKNERGLLYNDKEYWGIGQAEGEYIPSDVEVLSKEDTIKLISSLFNISPNEINITNDAQVIFRVPVDDIEGVYVGEKLAHRWDNKPTAYCNDIIKEPSLHPLTLRFPRKRELTSIPCISVENIYKFLKREYAEDMVCKGNIRIATLHEFHDTVQYSGSIADAHQGEKTLYTRKDIIEGSQKDLPDFAQESLHVAGKVNLPNTIFEKFEESPNCYIYCTTLKRDVKYWLSTGKDTCVKIKDPIEFFKIVTDSVADKAEFVGFAKCIYVHSRAFDTQTRYTDHPALLKLSDNSKQREVRAIWKAKVPPVEPFIITIPKIIPLCTIV